MAQGKKKVLISCGPIPARLDSVKFITNRFKGGLAFETARRLINKGYDVTVVKWQYTELPKLVEPNTVVDVEDVVDYYNFIKEHCNEYNAFVLAAAVANLMPSAPYEGKFPSHNYKEGEKFNIEFEIAPRAIDIIKKLNPRCCLIGYKLYDANTDEELIEIGRKTLKESKANIIFANTPATAKNRKIALTQDGAHIEFDFDQHIEFICDAIEQKYFSTVVKPIEQLVGFKRDLVKIADYKKLVKYFESTFDEHGTVAFRVPGLGMVTTSRGHSSEPVFISSLDERSKQIIADGKATLNAPLLWKILKRNKDFDYIVHRHFDDKRASILHAIFTRYRFPGTVEEAELDSYLSCNQKLDIENHGYLEGHKIEDVNWNQYYDIFPEKYFGAPEQMMRRAMEIINNPDAMTLDIGSNTESICRYSLDEYVDTPNGITYDDLNTEFKGKFDLILLRNSINYLTPWQLEVAKAGLAKGGILIGNSFIKAPNIKITDCEVAIKDGEILRHYLIVKDQIYMHEFFSRGEEEYKKMGFIVERYSKTGIIVTYKNNE